MTGWEVPAVTLTAVRERGSWHVSALGSASRYLVDLGQSALEALQGGSLPGLGLGGGASS